MQNQPLSVFSAPLVVEPHSLLWKVGNHWSVGDWQQVIAATRLIGQRFPRMKVGHYVEAHAYHRLGEETLKEQAIGRYAAGSAQAHAYLVPWATAATLAAADMPDLALNILRQGKHLAAQFPAKMRSRMIASYLQAGSAWHQRGQQREALEIFRLAPQIDPDHFDYTHLGTRLYELGELKASSAAYKHALTLESNDAAAHINLGWNHYLQDEPDAAIEQYLLALQLSRHSTALFHLGLAYLSRGDGERAEEIYARAIAEFGAEEGVRIGAVAQLRELVEREKDSAVGRRILERHWPDR